MNTTTHRPATDKQIAFLTRLVSERVVDLATARRLDLAREQYRAGTLTTAAASALIDALMDARRKDATPDAPAAPAAPGLYVRTEDGQPVVYRVKQNQARTGTYAARLIIDTYDGAADYRWEYAPGIGARIAAAGLVPLTGGEAGRLGLAHGRCVNCSAPLGGSTLSAQVSAVIGYGETCARRNGWEYPKGAKAQRAFIAAAR